MLTRTLRLVCLVALAAIATPAAAASIGEVAPLVDRAVAGQLPEDQEQALFGALGEISAEVANRYDAYARTSSSDARNAAVSLADALLPLLERLYDYHQGRIDQAQNKIIQDDGNPEVLYDQKWWQLDRGFSLAAAGQLSWLHLRAALLHPENKEKRQQWLKKSVKEFSEFVYSQDPKLSGESLLGRAIAENEQGEKDEARGDLQAIIDRGSNDPLYAQAKQVQGQVRGASTPQGDPLVETQKMLAEAAKSGDSAENVNSIKMMRFEAMANALGKGKLDEAGKKEAQTLSRELSAVSPQYSKRVYELALSNTKDPRQLLGNSVSAEWVAAENLASAEKFQEAIPAYESVLRSTDPGAREHAVEAHHRLGICQFRLGHYVEAEREFRAFLNGAPQSPLAGEAAYLQMRSIEGMFRAKPTADTRDMFTAAIENYVKSYPKHENHYEGAFRLGEIYQQQRRFQEAADLYAQVNGPPAFEVRARAAEVQCLADVLTNAPKDAKPEWAAPIRARAGKVFEAFDKAAANPKAGADAELRARATLARAMTQTSGPGPQLADSLVTLQDFEKKYPNAKEMVPLAGVLRLAGASGLGRYDDAANGVKMLPSTKENPGFADILDKIGHNFLRTAADVSVNDPAMGQKWASLAGTVFDRLHADGRAMPDDVKTNMAQIYVEQNRWDEAAGIYKELLAAQPKSKTLLRNSAQVADHRNQTAESADLWGRLAMLEEVATPPWYEARIATAKAMLAAGQGDKACKSVQEVDGFRPDLRDQPTKQKFQEIAAKACKG